jgi:hypothetical protein
MVHQYDYKLCSKCKGRGWCGKPCIILGKLNQKILEIRDSKKDFSGSSPPSVFIGSKLKYPNVNVGIMSLPEIKENAWIYNSPDYWSKEGVPSQQIVRFRKNLINARIKAKTIDIRKSPKVLAQLQEIGMSSVKSDAEIKLEKKPVFKLDFSEHMLPMGPAAKLRKITLSSNPKIPFQIDKVYFDTELKSSNALKYLYKKGFNEHTLSQILSIGSTGLKKNRKLAPTRWSITAVDDTIGKQLLTKIRNYKIIESPFLHFGGHLGNFYLILFFPQVFSYELFEAVFPQTTWNPSSKAGIEVMTDYEGFQGRKEYAFETAGGYYAARLPILQYLEKIKKQASILSLRFVLPDYDVPLGVWVCRNSVRKSLESQEKTFNTKQELLSYSEQLVKNNFNFSIKKILEKSKLLTEIKTQKRLREFF